MAPSPAAKQAPAKADKPADPKNPLEFCAAVSEDNLEEMRGTFGVYFFDYNFDINLVTNPQVSVSTNFAAAVPDGSPQPNLNGSTAIFQDNNVSYIAGPANGGLMSQVMVTGRDNVVFANTQFNIHLPNASTLTPTINVSAGRLPQRHRPQVRPDIMRKSLVCLVLPVVLLLVAPPSGGWPTPRTTTPSNTLRQFRGSTTSASCKASVAGMSRVSATTPWCAWVSTTWWQTASIIPTSRIGVFQEPGFPGVHQYPAERGG